MLIRIVFDNIFSFGEEKEFNLIPHKRLKTLNHHKYDFNGFEVLKTSSIYGANGAGKSNLVKCISLLQDLVIEENIPYKLRDSKFKFTSEKENRNQIIGIEFFQGKTPFYYAVEFNKDQIVTEELYQSGLGIANDEIIFERKTDTSEKTNLKFSEEFENDEKSQILKSILLEEFVSPNKPILKLLANRENKFLALSKEAFNWFYETLQVIMPESRPSALAHRIDTDDKLKKYAEELMCSFNIGISALKTEKKSLREFFGEDREEEITKWTKRVEKSPKKMIGISVGKGIEIVIVKEEKDIWVKNLQVEHTGKSKISAWFDLDEESDGTIRLLDFVPAIQDVIAQERVYLIDEIERSIHPLLIRELVRKFSLDSKTKGQLIFTTHESNLLNQELFRQDEIWFAEKDKSGTTDLYSLVDFKEHKTIDIRKGYLNGRYGSIPFLGNLQDLNWHQYDLN